ncbi:MAG: hypothetical protein M3P33_03555 [bacterium]|nr:hypothetical protein [bacterium]
MLKDQLKQTHTFLKKTPSRMYLGILLMLLALTIVCKALMATMYANPPKITIVSPKPNTDIYGEIQQIKGKVSPPQSHVFVNNKEVYSDANGEFTQEVILNEGKNTLKISAQRYGKKSIFVFSLNRLLTVDELAAKEEKLKAEIKKKLEDAEKLSNQPSTNPSVESIVSEPAFLQTNIKSKDINLTDDGAIVSGIYQNYTNKTIGWVKITANVKDFSGETIEIVDAYVTSSTQLLAPLAEIRYVVGVSSMKFDSIELDTTYDEI